MPNFGKLKFSHSLVGGAPIGSYSTAPGLGQDDRYNGSTLQIFTGTLGSDQESFTTKFKHS